VEYGTGKLFLRPTHLWHRAYNRDWWVRPFYNNLYTDDPGSGEPKYVGLAGRGWALEPLLYTVTTNNGDRVLLYSPRGVTRFDRVGATDRFKSVPSKPGVFLVHNATAAEYQMAEPDGRVILFNDDTVSPIEAVGRYKGFMDPGRNRWKAEEDPVTHDIVYLSCTMVGTQVVCTVGVAMPAFRFKFGTIGGEKRTLEADFYIYTSGAQNPELFLARVLYEYYTVDETDKGLVGDLKRVRIQRCSGNCSSANPTWVDWLTTYYRYYTSSSSIGFSHGLKYVLNPEGYQRMVDAGLTPESATDAQLAGYAEFYYEYESSKRVSKERRYGTGTGSQAYTFAYTARVGGTDGFNEWKLKTVETRPDGATTTVYTNYLGQVILKDFQSGTKHWYEYSEYDTEGRLIRKAMPSAVASYTQGSSSPQTLTVTLNTSSGLIYENEYYGDADPAPGHLKTVNVKQGSGGSLIKVRAYEYEARDDGTLTDLKRYLMTKETLYLSDTDQSVTAVTNYGYTYHAGTTEVAQKTTTLPAVPTGENGSGSAVTKVETFDGYGLLTEAQDERGIKTQYTWAAERGKVTQQIENYLSGQSGAGKNVTTDYTLNNTGAVTQILGPKHKIDLNGTETEIRMAKWIVYDEANLERREAFGYQKTSDLSFTLINPVTIYRFDRANRVKDVIQAKKGSTVEVAGALTSGDSFPQSSWVRWTNLNFDSQSNLTYQRLYHSIPGSGSGSSGTNYNQTDYGYSALRLANRVKTPGGTVHRVVYDPRKFETEYWTGTDDTGATDSNPAGSSSTSNNMVVIRKQEFDGNADKKDGNLTKTTLYENASTLRETTYACDWRNRRTDLDGEVDLYEKYQYDNQDRLTITERRNTTSGGALVWKREVRYDKRGRIYKRILYPASGANSLAESIWFDEAENVIKRQQPGSALFEKFLFDALGRVIKRYWAYGTDANYAAVKVVTSNVVMRQEDWGFDDAGNRLQQLVRERYHNESASNLGELGVPTDSVRKARVTCRAYWPDGIRRLQAEADYGTNGTPNPWSWSRPATIPGTSGSVLVTRQTYDITGELASVTVPSGPSGSPGTQVTTREYDHAARLIRVIENFLEGQTGSDKNKTTEFEYTGDGNLKKLTAKNSTTLDQVTEWVYGTTLSDSDLASNQLVRQKIYPDSADSSDRVYLKWDRQTEPREFRDQATTVHTLQYDKLGRLLHDRVTTLASGVDGAVRRITATYGVNGLSKLTSWDNAAVGSGAVVNEVELIYNEFEQITEDRQSHAGAVVPASTPKVQYQYENGSANHVRLKKIVYPTTSKFLDLLYGTASQQDDTLSRVKQLQFTQASAAVVTEYTYLGLDRPVVVDYPQPDVKLNLAAGSGNYPYTGLDPFDRLLEALWLYYGTPNADREKVDYGYDLAANRLTRDNLLSGSAGQDEKYGYDGLWQITTLDRGTLSGGNITSKVFAQAWTFDPTGNWDNFKQDNDGNGTWDLNQNRTHNKANEILTIASSSISHDLVGNVTRMPQVGNWGASYDLVYDAWNRLVLVKTVEASPKNVAAYAYDGFYRRTVKKTYTAGGALDKTRDYFYSLGWQALEERLDSGSGPVLNRQFVWGQRHIDDLVLRDRDTGSDGTLDERLYALHDAMHVTAVTNTAGAVQERYGYDGFGKPRFLDASFGPRSASSYDWETLFDAYRFDPETNLYHVRFRYLHPNLGRWISRDPLGERAGISLYSYAWNNPLNRRDPNGLSVESQLAQLAYEIQYWKDILSEFPPGSGTYIGAEAALAKALAEYNALSQALYAASASLSGFLAADLSVACSVSATGVVAAGAAAAAAGGAVGYGASQLPVIGGGTVADFWGDVIHDALPGFWNWLVR
jgi:RHS repeat-associated protein